MDSAFWHQRWQEGRTGFHQDRPTPLLLQHWPSLGLAPGSQVFVPLAGKSLDLAWLAAQGHRVLGVELSPLAVTQFFDGQGLVPEVHGSRHGRHYRAGDIELICGDAFALDADVLAGCAAVYDRAALIALPPPLRQRSALQERADALHTADDLEVDAIDAAVGAGAPTGPGGGTVHTHRA